MYLLNLADSIAKVFMVKCYMKFNCLVGFLLSFFLKHVLGDYYKSECLLKFYSDYPNLLNLKANSKYLCETVKLDVQYNNKYLLRFKKKRIAKKQKKIQKKYFIKLGKL